MSFDLFYDFGKEVLKNQEADSLAAKILKILELFPNSKIDFLPSEKLLFFDVVLISENLLLHVLQYNIRRWLFTPYQPHTDRFFALRFP